MSTEQSAATRLPVAIERLEKLANLERQLPAQIAAARADVTAILAELGIDAKPAKRAAPRRAPAAGGTPKPPPPALGETTLAVLEVIARAGDAGATTADIAAVTGMASGPIAAKLAGLEKSATKRVVCDRTGDQPYRWRLTGPVPELAARQGTNGSDAGELVTAIRDAAGVEA